MRVLRSSHSLPVEASSKPRASHHARAAGGHVGSSSYHTGDISLLKSTVKVFPCGFGSVLTSRMVHATRNQRGNQIRDVQGSASSEACSSMTPMECGRRLARRRARESSGKRGPPLLVDGYAGHLLEGWDSTEDEGTCDYDEAADLISARFIDDELLVASGMVNTNRNQEYNQVVLIGDGMCTRFYRLPWPTGIVVYLIAPGEVHERAEAIFAQKKLRGPRGCLLRRVNYNIDGDMGFADALVSSGFRADRLSVWALQGISCMTIGDESLRKMFTDIANMAALESIVVGEVPIDMTAKGTEELLSSVGFLGRSYPLSTIAGQLGILEYQQNSLRNEKNDRWAILACNEDPSRERRVFRAHQRRLSVAEMDIYEAHVAEAEDIGEDFFGNFS